MLQLPTNISLSNRSIGFLGRWQGYVDGEPTYKLQIARAKKEWGKNNKTFDEIKEKLRSMLNETNRCSYCEDSVADEIEHIYPKDIYPDKAFVWENYLYSCGPCNGPKSNKFALIDASGALAEIIRPRPIPAGYVYVPPSLDPTALIDPRVEDPMNYIDLDITITFRYVPNSDLAASDILRAQYTIDILRLNDREYLVKARKAAFGNFKARLSEYITKRDGSASQITLDLLRSQIMKIDHQTVWAEMKRFNTLVPELKALFDKAPEALTW